MAAISLGCAKNRIDTEEILGYLSGKGFILTDDYKSADLIIVNTCSFIEEAQQESVNTLLELVEEKDFSTAKRPKIVAAGCLVEIFGDKITREMPFVDGAIGVHSYSSLDTFVNDLFKGERPVIKQEAPKEYCSLAPRVLTSPVHSANLKIAEGCNNRCHYCLIPLIRGPYRSRNPEEIVNEAAELADRGAKEINIIAQDTTAYGHARGEYPDLCGLIKKILAVRPGFRLRIMYTYPSRINDELIELVAGEPRVCNYLDVPIQHCSDHILKKMGRHYDKKDLEALFFKLRRRIPGLALRTTVMVGYPGETVADFEELSRFIEEFYFESLGAFIHSPQESTPAVNNARQVSKRVGRRRYRQLMIKQQHLVRRTNEKRIGEYLNVLVEGPLPGKSGWYYGKSEYQAPEVDGVTYFRAKKPLAPGTPVKVKVRAVSAYNFIAKKLGTAFSRGSRGDWI
ncbi:MAG: 30S ribosomal protein S12 methylthiotransferase RimO [Bacillota bacterium]